MEHPVCFGIRHLSPAGAYHLRRLLDEREPELILVEGLQAYFWAFRDL